MRILFIYIYTIYWFSFIWPNILYLPGNIINVTGEVDENLSHYTYFHNTGDSGLILKWKLFNSY